MHISLPETNRGFQPGTGGRTAVLENPEPASVDNEEENKEKPALETDRLHSKNRSSDKPFNINKPENENAFFKLIHKYEGFSTYLAVAANLLGAVFMQLNFSDKFKKIISKITDYVTNSSFLLYGIDGCRKGAAKKNPYETLGFFLELTTVWLSDIKTKYLIRGAGTGTDQIWVATDHEECLGTKFPGGRFHDWFEGLVEVPKGCWKLLQEFINDPINTVFTLNSKGHKALLSSIGDIVATIGYALTGKEKFFGAIRDFSGILFDVEMLFKKQLIEKLSGLFFISESLVDYLARDKFSKNEYARLTLNMIAHALGRVALMCYKNSDPNANPDKQIKSFALAA